MKRNYYLLNNGTLKREDNSLSFVNGTGEKKYLPVNDVDNFYIFGEMNLNTSLINFIAQNGIILHFFYYYGFYTGSFYPKETLNSGMLTVKQSAFYLSKNKRLVIAKSILKAGAFNILHNIKYYLRNGKNELQTHSDTITMLSTKLDNQPDIPELMGIEGNIRKIYYDAFPIIINQDIEFETRIKNPPDNMINSLISFVNTLIYTTVLSEIYKTQLNPLISYLHQPGTRRFSLSLDISEIFKPLIGDRMIFSLLNKNQITKKSFEKELNYTYLTKKGKETILREYDERLKTTVRHKGLGRNVSYQHLIRLELYKLVKHLIGEKEYKGFKIWW
ncbi:MAG: type I-B CRISPR-associated endonuclease Cas1b [Candidatus Delongbacteria bacterium]|jgi:CRISPR-associated protein Cas1|nr:type I-B CRISPR-associated endonuclease Cas1b [Candidatus Delongbacteria bacterium]